MGLAQSRDHRVDVHTRTLLDIARQGFQFAGVGIHLH